MNRMQEAKMVPPIFIGRWTPEGHRCRVFLDPTGKDTHRSTRRYVPLGETTWPARQC
jgi:hypothetical protein